MMKNTFYFTLQALFVIQIIEFFDFLVKQKNGLIRKLTISRFMTSQTGQQIILIPILPNISRNKGDQAMKFGQLIECNMRNIFIEKS